MTRNEFDTLATENPDMTIGESEITMFGTKLYVRPDGKDFIVWLSRDTGPLDPFITVIRHTSGTISVGVSLRVESHDGLPPCTLSLTSWEGRSFDDAASAWLMLALNECPRLARVVADQIMSIDFSMEAHDAGRAP